jgi:hypothetical protein
MDYDCKDVNFDEAYKEYLWKFVARLSCLKLVIVPSKKASSSTLVCCCV